MARGGSSGTRGGGSLVIVAIIAAFAVILHSVF